MEPIAKIYWKNWLINNHIKMLINNYIKKMDNSTPIENILPKNNCIIQRKLVVYCIYKRKIKNILICDILKIYLMEIQT